MVDNRAQVTGVTDIGLWIVALLGPVAGFWLLAQIYAMATTWDFRRRPRQPRATGPGIEVLARNLRSLQQEYQRIEGSDLPAVTARLKAVSLAYDDILLDCCLALGVEQPHQPPLDPLTRLEVESQLARQGLIW